jgi:hypothetical protein
MTRVANRMSLSELRDLQYMQRREKKASNPKRKKYANQPVTVDGHLFDSKAEARYWGGLQVRLRAGEISDLRRQVPFELAPSVVIGGRKRPPIRYLADFVWVENGQTVVADVKGALVDVYRLKRHLMKSVHGIDILEIRS